MTPVATMGWLPLLEEAARLALDEARLGARASRAIDLLVAQSAYVQPETRQRARGRYAVAAAEHRAVLARWAEVREEIRRRSAMTAVCEVRP